MGYELVQEEEHEMFGIELIGRYLELILSESGDVGSAQL